MADAASPSAWNDGYVVDIAYTEPMTDYLCPAHLSMSAALHGQPPLPTRPLTWLDLGSGSGASACMVAAANPDLEVWGCDFNPAHVERSRGLAAAAGLDCRFEEASFAELAADEQIGPSRVDVIVVNGVYSWISRANQEHIGEIVRRRLNPGGVVFVSYGVATGWSAMTPIAEALHLRAQADGRRSDLTFTTAAAEVLRLADEGGRSFPLASHEAKGFEALRTIDPRYGAHEYLGAHFRPLMFAEVNEVMAAGRCSYLGSIDATDVLFRLGASVELIDLVAGATDVVAREMMRDLASERSLRKDVFRRGLATSTVVDQELWLRGLSVIGLDQQFPDDASVGVPLGSVGLDQQPLPAPAEPPGRAPDLRQRHPGHVPRPDLPRRHRLAGPAHRRRLRRPRGPRLEGRRRPPSDPPVQRGPHRGEPTRRRPPEPHLPRHRQRHRVGVRRDAHRRGRVVRCRARRRPPGRPRPRRVRRQRRQVREGGELVVDESAARAIVRKRAATALARMDGLFAAHGIC